MSFTTIQKCELKLERYIVINCNFSFSYKKLFVYHLRYLYHFFSLGTNYFSSFLRRAPCTCVLCVFRPETFPVSRHVWLTQKWVNLRVSICPSQLRLLKGAHAVQMPFPSWQDLLLMSPFVTVTDSVEGREWEGDCSPTQDHLSEQQAHNRWCLRSTWGQWTSLQGCTLHKLDGGAFISSIRSKLQRVTVSLTCIERFLLESSFS